jgi:hypothetical protein
MTKGHSCCLGFLSRLTVLAGVVALLSVGLVGSLVEAASFPAAISVKVSIPYERRTFKVVNDFVVVWQFRRWSDKNQDQIELFSRFGERLFTLNPLKAIRGATEVSIWDVAVGPTGLLAVAAVSADEEGRHAVSLLLYSSSGGLVRAYSLDRMVRRLAVDEDENVWALGENWGDEDPALVPVVFKYNRNGELVGRYVPRAELPPIINGDSGTGAGSDAMGLTEAGVWFWLPDRRALVTFHRDGTHIEISQIGAPNWAPPDASGSNVEVMFGRPCLLSTDTFVVPVSFRAATASDHAVYAWDKGKAAWKKLSSAATPLPKGGIVGTDGDRIVFGAARSDRPEIEFESVDLP